jgi:hypothetical protein
VGVLPTVDKENGELDSNLRLDGNRAKAGGCPVLRATYNTDVKKKQIRGFAKSWGVSRAG